MADVQFEHHDVLKTAGLPGSVCLQECHISELVINRLTGHMWSKKELG